MTLLKEATDESIFDDETAKNQPQINYFSTDESIQQMSILLSYTTNSSGNNNNNNNNNNLLFPNVFTDSHDICNYIDTHFDTILFDCDGVLYRDSSHIIPHSISMLHYWIEIKNKTILFVTNNAGQSRQDLLLKLSKLFHLSPSTYFSIRHMITSGYSAAKYLSFLSITTHTPSHTIPHNINMYQYIHVIGEDALRTEFQEMGFILVEHDDSTSSTSMTRDELASYPFHKVHRMDALVVGLDTRFNYRKLCIATGLLQRFPNALFIATNEDSYDVVGKDNYHLPGNGCIISALECASQRKAINVGKPTRILVDLLIQEHSMNVHRTLMVGDRLDTDIQLGYEGGMTSALVFTGCTTADTLRDILEQATMNVEYRKWIPHMVLPHVGIMVPDSYSFKEEKEENSSI